jgi:hypothetical protein
MELSRIKIDFSNVPSKYTVIYEWDDRHFTSLESAQNASSRDRVQGGCNVVVKWVRDPKKAKEFNYAGDWYDADTYRAK